MQEKRDTYDVGVVVGRFQVPELHDAHLDLIESVVGRHSKVIVVLGRSPLHGTRQNPLDYEARRQMVLESFPHVTVAYNDDQRSDEVWSGKLDKVISNLLTPNQTAVIYGSRDSFIDHYSGAFPTCELVQERYVSGSEVRKRIAAAATVDSVDFRRGVVWSAYGRYPTCFTTVDVAVFDESGANILLARKPHESEWRLIGGFSDPRSPTFEADARREVSEEAGIEITDPVYIDSHKIDDWRYRGELDVIKTLLFKATLFSGRPNAKDDIAELKWFQFSTLRDTQLVPEHVPLIDLLRKERS